MSQTGETSLSVSIKTFDYTFKIPETHFNIRKTILTEFLSFPARQRNVSPVNKRNLSAQKKMCIVTDCPDCLVIPN